MLSFLLSFITANSEMMPDHPLPQTEKLFLRRTRMARVIPNNANCNECKRELKGKCPSCIIKELKYKLANIERRYAESERKREIEKSRNKIRISKLLKTINTSRKRVKRLSLKVEKLKESSGTLDRPRCKPKMCKIISVNMY